MTLANKVRELSELRDIAATLDTVMEGLRLEIETEMDSRSRNASVAEPAATMDGAKWLLGYGGKGGAA